MLNYILYFSLYMLSSSVPFLNKVAEEREDHRDTLQYSYNLWPLRSICAADNPFPVKASSVTRDLREDTTTDVVFTIGLG